MYKMLIVDDDDLILNGLIDLIDFSQYELEVVGTAKNGLEALAYIELNPVDLLITDIRMPKMDGLELIRNIRRSENPKISEIKCIVLSAYSDFQYVKEAIPLGIENYILKPVDENELQQTLNNILSKFEAELRPKEVLSSKTDVIKHNILLRWLSGEIDELELKERAKMIGFPLDDQVFWVGLIWNRFDGSQTMNALKILEKNLTSYFDSTIHAQYLTDLFGHLVLILSSDKTSDSAKEVQQGLNALMQKLSDGGLKPLFCLHTNLIPSYRKVHEHYLQLVKLCNGVDTIPNQLVKCVDEMNKELFMPDSIKSELLIAEIKAYITENYASDMNLKTIAANFDMNAFYLGQIFKTVIGDTFTSYLNQFRVEKAKTLLSDPFVKVIDVAEKVGYYNTNYFYTIFKKITGMTPANYSAQSRK